MRLALLLVVSIGCTVRAAPDPQRKYLGDLSALRQEWQETGSNEVARSAVEGRVRDFFHPAITVTNWVCRVQRITTVLGSTKISTTYAEGAHSLRFNLWFEGTPPSLVSDLREGDYIQFSGVVAGEESVTMHGAMEDPEIKVLPQRLERRPEN